MADDISQVKKEALALPVAKRVELAGDLVKSTNWMLVPGKRCFPIAVIEALLKCAPFFAIQFLAIYPLLAQGQGKEAMRRLLDPGPVNISLFLFPLALTYSCVLTWFFLFFLLKQWNYPADNKARALRIWIPSVLSLIIGFFCRSGLS